MWSLSAIAYGVLIVAISIVAVLLPACSQPAPLPTVPPGTATEVPLVPTVPLPPASAEVRIRNDAFHPPEVRISPYQVVAWVNDDNIQHTVTGSNFDSGPLQPGQRYEHLFRDEGTYNYHCTIHPQMTGRVVVSDEGRPAAGQTPGQGTPSGGIPPGTQTPGFGTPIPLATQIQATPVPAKPGGQTPALGAPSPTR